MAASLRTGPWPRCVRPGTVPAVTLARRLTTPSGGLLALALVATIVFFAILTAVGQSCRGCADTAKTDLIADTGTDAPPTPAPTASPAPADPAASDRPAPAGPGPAASEHPPAASGPAGSDHPAPGGSHPAASDHPAPAAS